MRFGDISNERAAGMGIRFELIVRGQDGSLNKQGKGFLERLASSEFNIYVITTGDKRKTLAYLAKWNVPYNYVLDAETLFEIADLCIEHKLIQYYDTDTHVVSNVISRGKQRTEGVLWTLEESS